MSSFVIFDPKNNLILSKCDDAFRKILLQINTNHSDEQDETDEMVHNWLAVYLTPYVSMFRELPEGNMEFDVMPSTLVVHKNYQEFIFMHLICQQQRQTIENNDEDQNDADEPNAILNQFKVNIFCHAVIFLCGNAFYFVARNEAVQQTLFEMMEQWNLNRSEMSLIIESIEKLYVGYHIARICEELVCKLERILKLEMKTLNKEIFSFCFIMYRNKLVYKFESNTRVRLKPRDLTMIMLLSQLINDEENDSFDVSQQNHIKENHHQLNKVDQLLVAKQNLVFLQSSNEIPIPHLYRKIVIDQDLYIVCLSELPSVMMISLPTLVHSVIDYKTNMLDVKHNSKRSIDYLIKCIKSMDKYIQKNLDAFSQRHLFNMSSLDNLNQLAKKAHSRRTSQTDDLIQEQTERIFTVLMDSLYQSYEKVFKTLYIETIENHFKPFHRLKENLHSLDAVGKLKNCLDFINLKCNKNVQLLDNLQALQVYSNLLAFIFVNRIENFFLEDHRDSIEDEIQVLYRNLVLKAYRQAIESNKNIVFWSNEPFFYVYVCWTESLLTLKETAKEEEERPKTKVSNSPAGKKWPNIFIDEWFQKKNVLNEFFAIVDLKSLENIQPQIDQKFWLDYLINIVNKIKSHIDLPI